MSDISLGESYPYWSYINSPSQMGISTSGSAFTNDVKALLAYPQLLIQGNGSASSTGQPLGDQYFLQTGGQCCAGGVMDSSTGSCANTVDRYIYINNIPDGSIPFIANETSSDNSNPKGILIGILEDIGDIGDGIGSLFTAFTSSTLPTCNQITLQVVNNDNVTSCETEYVANSDVPEDQPQCESFSNIYNMPLSNVQSLDKYYPSDQFIQLYYFFILILGLYIFYKLAYFSKK
jgi:hypothetical protein